MGLLAAALMVGALTLFVARPSLSYRSGAEDTGITTRCHSIAAAGFGATHYLEVDGRHYTYRVESGDEVLAEHVRGGLAPVFDARDRMEIDCMHRRTAWAGTLPFLVGPAVLTAVVAVRPSRRGAAPQTVAADRVGGA